MCKGYPSNAFQYIKDLGLVEDVYYPYRAAVLFIKNFII